jgi:hypothetical protein
MNKTLQASGTWTALAVVLAAALPAAALEIPDPGKGYDYVFYGWCPAYGEGGPGNRAMLLMDLDDTVAVDPPQGGADFAKNFKTLVANDQTSGRLDVASYTAHRVPAWESLNSPGGTPYRWRFTTSGGPRDQLGEPRIEQNAIFEYYDRHYLRSVMDVVHDDAWTRYLTNCGFEDCAVAEPPYWQQDR